MQKSTFGITANASLFALLISTSGLAQAQTRMEPPVINLTDVTPAGLTVLIFGYRQPPEYERWWRELAACQNMALPEAFREIHFFALSVRAYKHGDSDWVGGNAQLREGQINLAFPYVMNEAVVKHEMLHFLMYWNGEAIGHGPERYGTMPGGRCGVYPVIRVIDG